MEPEICISILYEPTIRAFDWLIHWHLSSSPYGPDAPRLIRALIERIKQLYQGSGQKYMQINLYGSHLLC